MVSRCVATAYGATYCMVGASQWRIHQTNCLLQDLISAFSCCAASSCTKCPTPSMSHIRARGIKRRTSAPHSEVSPGRSGRRRMSESSVVAWMLSNGSRAWTSGCNASAASHRASSLRMFSAKIGSRHAALAIASARNCGGLFGVNIPSTFSRSNAGMPCERMRSRNICSSRGACSRPVALPSMSAIPATPSGDWRNVSRTTRHPMLWPARITGPSQCDLA